MYTWITVWVLTVYGSFNYQLTYSSENECKQNIETHIKGKFTTYARCDKQKTPIAIVPK